MKRQRRFASSTWTTGELSTDENLKPPRRRAITYTLAGLGALVLLNILRLLIITAVAYGDVTQIQLVHNTLGYALFTAFYLAYAILLIRRTQPNPNPRHPEANQSG